MDITTLSTADLRDLQSRIAVELKNRSSKERADALQKISSIMKDYDLSVEDLQEGSAKSRKKSGPAPIKYRHPDNSELTWTGRGRKPKWIEAYLAEDKSMESLLAA